MGLEINHTFLIINGKEILSKVVYFSDRIVIGNVTISTEKDSVINYRKLIHESDSLIQLNDNIKINKFLLSDILDTIGYMNSKYKIA